MERRGETDMRAPGERDGRMRTGGDKYESKRKLSL